MLKLDLSRPIHYGDVGVTVYRGAMSPELCQQISGLATAFVKKDIPFVMEQGKESRRFKPSKVLALGSIPVLEEVVGNTFSGQFSTMRLNLQGPRGKQGWHQDYILEPLVLYPEGNGFIDFNLDASTLSQARNEGDAGATTTVPVLCGDVAELERGSEIFHRGRNAAIDATRITTVLH